MVDQNVFEEMTRTYRTLNARVRVVDETRLSEPHAPEPSAKDVMRRLRDDEMRFSQALKEHISGVPIPDLYGHDDSPTLGMETANDTTAMLIAQFGTARESTLAMLRGLAEQDWDATTDGKTSIRGRVNELVVNDKRQMARITTLLGLQ